MWATPTFKRWKNPHSLTVISHGGEFAAIEITHYGEPATWEARMRIVKTAPRQAILTLSIDSVTYAKMVSSTVLSS
jgi:hypothetical protein